MSVKKRIEGSLPEGTIVKSSKHSYLVEEVLGAGGFGITYKVSRVSDRSTFALKEYFPCQLCTRDDDNTTMTFFKTNSEAIKTGMSDFLTEAKRLNRQNISHPNIVAVDEAFTANNTAYYVMEYVEGMNLRQYITKQNHNEPITESQALSVIKLVLQAVALLHANKLTHLDIKHDNIILSQEEDGALRPVLIDFGQSKHYDRKGNATSRLTNAGCTDGFAPQEQYLGLTQFTPQADVYALCATLLYLLTAKVPVKSSEITAAHIENMLGDKVSEKIKRAIISGMKSSKEQRTQSVEALALDLGLELETDLTENSVTRILGINGSPKFHRKKMVVYIGAAVVSAILVTGIVWLLTRTTTPTEQPTELVLNEEEGQESISGNADNPDNPSPYNELVSSNESPTPQPTEHNETNSRIDEESSAPTGSPSAQQHQMEDMMQPNNDSQVSAAENAEQHSENDDQLFAKANATGDWDTMKRLADKGYKKAYLPLAKYYCSKAKTHGLADKYAQKAKAAGISGADEVISILEGLGYYD